jgi:hypothetical protein
LFYFSGFFSLGAVLLSIRVSFIFGYMLVFVIDVVVVVVEVVIELTWLAVVRSSLFLALALDFLGCQSFQARERAIQENHRLFEVHCSTSFFCSMSVNLSGSIR